MPCRVALAHVCQSRESVWALGARGGAGTAFSCAFESITYTLTLAHIFAPRELSALSLLCLHTEVQPAACSRGDLSMD